MHVITAADGQRCAAVRVCRRICEYTTYITVTLCKDRGVYTVLSRWE